MLLKIVQKVWATFVWKFATFEKIMQYGHSAHNSSVLNLDFDAFAHDHLIKVRFDDKNYSGANYLNID